MQSFRGKSVLITGASSGIGKATALRLASQGANLGLAARSLAALEELAAEVRSLGGHAQAIATDVTDSAQCQRAVEKSLAAFGKLDVVISSAGLSLRAYFEGTRLDVLERVMQVNFFGTMYMTHFALPHVK